MYQKLSWETEENFEGKKKRSNPAVFHFTGNINVLEDHFLLPKCSLVFGLGECECLTLAFMIGLHFTAGSD